MNRIEISFLEPAGVPNLEPTTWAFIKDATREATIPSERNRSNVTYEELELIAALRRAEEPAFTTLIERYHGPLLRFAQSFVNSHAVAEEVVQETWMAVLKAIHRFEGRSSLKTWIFRILQNIAKTKGIREHRYVSFADVGSTKDQEEDGRIEPERFHTSGHLTGHWVTQPTTWEENTPERLLVSKESLSQVKQAIQTLPPLQRQVIILRDIENIDSEEICQLLNITPTNQRVLLHRARSKVREALLSYLHGHSPKTLQPVVDLTLAVSQ